MKEPVQYLADAEVEALRELKGELGHHLAALMEGVLLIEQSFGALRGLAVQESSISQKVAFSLAVRLGNDLRCTSIVSGIGMPAQSVALAAGSFESAYTLAYVAGNDERAKAWVSHDDPKRLFVPIRQLVQTVVNEVLESPDETQVERRYRNYVQLCMGKHGNPLFAKNHSFQSEPGAAVVALGPTTHEDAVRALQFALEQSIGHATVGLAALANTEPKLRADDEFVAKINSLNEDWTYLHNSALERWGRDDPFKGKW